MKIYIVSIINFISVVTFKNKNWSIFYWNF